MLLAHIERHLKKGRIPPTRFGRHAVGDPNFVSDLRDGRDPRACTVRRVTAYLDRLDHDAGDTQVVPVRAANASTDVLR